MLLIWMSKNSLQYFKQEGATGNTADPWHFWDVQFVEMFLFSSTNIVWKDEISNEIYVLCLADKTCFFVSPFSLSLSLSLSSKYVFSFFVLSLSSLSLSNIILSSLFLTFFSYLSSLHSSHLFVAIFLPITVVLYPNKEKSFLFITNWIKNTVTIRIPD